VPVASRRTLAARSLIGDTVDYRIDPDERASFKRCRRQWELASPHRRDLEPVEVVGPALPAALKDALAVYYFPGTWDWQHDLTQSLVHKAFERSLDEVGATDGLNIGLALLDCYDAWATIADHFAPVRIDHDVEGLLPDPRDPERGLLTPDGRAVIYTCRIDLLAVDAADEYWVVRHRISDDWEDLGTLIRDEEAVAACWTWEQAYMGMEIAGTIHNEVRMDGPLEFPPAERRAKDMQKLVGQNEASGGGRSIPKHRRIYARSSRSGEASRTEQRTAGILRRTHIRRTRDEIAAAGMLIGAEALDMTCEPTTYPAPAAHCHECEFNAPCLVMFEGADPEPLLAANFRRTPEVVQPKPRLGQATWSFGRGAAPPQW
jgi:hypothetical protein